MTAIAATVGPRPRVELVQAMARALTHRPGDAAEGDATATASGRELHDPRRDPVLTVRLGDDHATGERAAAIWHGWPCPDGRLTIAWDGEIHNRPALLASLAGSEGGPADGSDAALAAALYARFGIDGMARIDGPFAVAIIDRRPGRLVLARDLLGVRPLHYASDGEGNLHVASEVQALLVNPAIERTPNMGAIVDVLTHLHVSGDDSFFDGIRSVPPGHAVVIEEGAADVRRFRDLVFSDDGPTDEAQAVDRFSQLLVEAVRRDVDRCRPVGVALSGGIDSAAIAALAVSVTDAASVRTAALANEFDLAAGTRPPSRLPQGERCEAVRASFLASWLGVGHREHLVRGRDLLDAIPVVIDRFAAPHTSSYAPFLLAQRWSNETPRLISGLGADELLRGYGRSLTMQNRVGECIPTADGDAVDAAARAYQRIDAHLSPFEQHALLHPDHRDVLSSPRVAPAAIAARLGAADELRTADAGMYLDLSVQVANEYLPTTDLSFGHHGISVGLPFLDLALVEFVLSLPLSLRSHTPSPKHLLRRAIESRLPRGYLDLPKTGFALPIARWIDGPLRTWVDEMLAPDAVRARGWFAPTAVEALRSRHARGVERRSEALWTLAMIETWARHWIDETTPRIGTSRPLEIEVGPAIVQVEAQLGSEACTKAASCLDRHFGQHRPLVGDYIGVSVPVAGQTVSSWIDLRTLEFDDYETRVRRTVKGAGLRHARKADRAGYQCERFVYGLHVPDIAEINHSKAERSAGPMTARYRRSVDELGGAPTEAVELAPPECPLHHDTWWGIFEPRAEYRQGEVAVDRKLVGYIRLRRHGNYALLSKILGHGDHLDDGIMYRLLLAVIEWLCARDELATQGIDHLIYANHNHLPPGLRQWKRKMQFGPALLVEPPTRRRMQRAASPVAARQRGPAFVPLGENCLADDVVRRHGLDPVINPYSYGRTNLDYALELEELGYDRLLDRQHLVAATSGTQTVVRSTAVIDCDPIFHPKHDLGFEFTHHDVLSNDDDRASIERKVARLHDLRGRRPIWFFYHHRLHDGADLDAVVAKAERFVDHYGCPDGPSRFVVFGQQLVESADERGIHRVDHSDRVVSFVMRTFEAWEGDDDDLFWARPDDDLFAAMFDSLGLGRFEP